MNEKEVKKVIKAYVREALVEIFAEMNLETIVENAVKKTAVAGVGSSKSAAPSVAQPVAKPPLSIREVYSRHADVEEENPYSPQSPARTMSSNGKTPEERRKIIMQKIGTMDDVWKDIYADTASRGSPILDGDAAPADAELVSEADLAKLGLMKDYSKHIGQDPAKQEQDAEWKELRERRRQILENTLKRNG